MKTYFFGWENFKWICRELYKIYSTTERSFFSKKRIESGIAFIVLQYGMIHWLAINVNKMPAEQLWIWATIECAIIGYTLNKIEAEKTIESK